MKLGFLTAPFPDTPLMDVADWAASADFEVLEIVAPADFKTRVVDAPKAQAAE